jgi:hypothetical protein
MPHFLSLQRTAALAALGFTITLPRAVRAQEAGGPHQDLSAAAITDSSYAAPEVVAPEVHAYSFRSTRDSVAWARARRVAERADGFRIVVSLQDRHVWAISGDDTLLSAPAAVAKGTTLDFGGKEWTFTTPRGVRHVLGKESDPIWIPPEWLYAETAQEYGLHLAHLRDGERHVLSDGRILTVQDSLVGVVDDNGFEPLPVNEHVVFDNTLFIPPTNTVNRHVKGELGKYRLILGDGYLLHGTPDKNSIGMAATHGCIRLRDDDIQWLYDNVPVGTPVYIY